MPAEAGLDVVVVEGLVGEALSKRDRGGEVAEMVVVLMGGVSALKNRLPVGTNVIGHAGVVGDDVAVVGGEVHEAGTRDMLPPEGNLLHVGLPSCIRSL
jgi:hypothetical protein